MATITEDDLHTSLPHVTGTLTLSGLDGPVTIVRDHLGIPHIQATTSHDAFFGQGFAIAQDRLWQMDFDRKRACGRSAEVLGQAGVDFDILVRRMRFEANALADYAATSDSAREMFDAYAAGVNAFISSTAVLPIEYKLLDVAPEPWRPHDGLAIARVRHVFMGNFEFKLWRAKLLAQVGPELTRRLFPSSDPGGLVILPPGAEFPGERYDGRDILASEDTEDLTRYIRSAFSDTSEAGSNSWVLHGALTASGKPLLAGDPHRAPDTPNVYVQNHISCPEFDAIGLSFAGVPSFFHFGHSQHVAWCVTHASADYQDLYVERFFPDDNPPTYEYKGERRSARVHRETIAIRGAEPVEFDVVATRHGPIIMGSPEEGIGIAFRYTATAQPSGWADSLIDMLHARNVDEFEESMRPWVDPCNNLMSADVDGNVSYLMRGRVPIRSRHNAWVPVPGWDGHHEWRGAIPFEELPRLRNPENGFIVTANNRIVDHFNHYISMDYWPDFRGRRIVSRLDKMTGATVADMAAIHGDRISLLARQIVPALSKLTPTSDHARRALYMLGEWDCAMDRERIEPTIYSAVLTALIRRISIPLLGERLTNEAINGVDRGGPAHLRGLRVIFANMLEQNDTSLLPAGKSWESVLASSFDEAIAWLRETLGEDIADWKWGVLHRTRHTHPLAGLAPEFADLLNPPSIDCGGDSETPQQGGFAPGRPFTVYTTSVARYVYDLNDWNNCWWVVPLGSSGHPGSPHYADQMERWADVRLYPMLYDWTAIHTQAESVQELVPDPPEPKEAE